MMKGKLYCAVVDEKGYVIALSTRRRRDFDPEQDKPRVFADRYGPLALANSYRDLDEAVKVARILMAAHRAGL